MNDWRGIEHLYAAFSLAWAVLAVFMQWREHPGAREPWRLAMVFLLNIMLMPLAFLAIAWRAIKDMDGPSASGYP